MGGRGAPISPIVGRIVRWILSVSVVVAAVSGSRLLVTTPISGAALVSAPFMWMCVVALLGLVGLQGELFSSSGLRRHGVPLAFAAVGVGVAVLGAASAADVRLLSLGLVPLASLGAYVAGLLLARSIRTVSVTVLVTGVVALVPAVFQTIQYRGFTTGLGQLMVISDARLWSIGFAMPITSRASGLDVNPNPFGLLGAVVLLYAFTGPRGKLLPVLAGVGAAIMALAASRTAVVASLLAVLVVVSLEMRGSSIASVARKQSRPLAAAVVGGFLAGFLRSPYVVWLEYLGVPRSSSLVEGTSLGRRFGAALEMLIRGQAADQNVTARFEQWRLALAAWRARPWGYFAQPDRVIGTSVDNEYLARLVEGGPAMVAAFALLLWWLVARVRPVRAPLFGVGLAVLLGTAGLMLNVMSTSGVIVLAWCLIGAMNAWTYLADDDLIDSHAR